MLASLPWEVERQTKHLDVAGETSAAGSFQSPQFVRIDSDMEDFAWPSVLIISPICGWLE